MRLHDVVTPEELRQIFERESREVKAFGERTDLEDVYVKNLALRVSEEYTEILWDNLGSHQNPIASVMRLLALIDRFLEEKYAQSNSTTN